MSKRAEKAVGKIHNHALLEAEKYATYHGGGIAEEVAYGRGFKAGFIKGYEQAEKDILALIESHLSEIIGDAQPKPALRAELEELIKRIKDIK
jgi:hypothetical protein